MKKFRKIVTFGDSFAWGDELLAPGEKNAADYGNRFYRQQQCYTGLVGSHYGVPTENLAFPGGSCQSTRWTYTWWRQQETEPESCLVLVQLSGPWRSSQFDRHRVQHETDHAWNSFAHSCWMESYRSSNPSAYQYFRLENDLADCIERNNLVQAETYLFFQGQASDVAALLMFNSQSPSLAHKIYPESLLWQGQELTQVINDPNCFTQIGHLNEAGHERLTTLLIQEIDRVILAE